MEAAVSAVVRLSLAALLLAAAAPGRAAEPRAKESVLLDKLRHRIEAVDARLDGVLGVYVEDLATGAKVELRADEAFPTASSIKLAVLYELYRQAHEGRIDLRKLTAPPPRPVQSEGILRFMSEETRITVRDLGLLVMTLSDNEAANELIRQVGMENVNRRLDGLSLRATRLRRLMMDLEAARQGRENVSTPRELAALARVVGTGEGLRPDLAADLAVVATAADPGSFARRGLPEGWRAVTKLGTLEGVRCETAWVDVPGRPYTLAIMTAYVGREAEAETAIAEISAAAYETFDRLARSSELGRVISERDTGK
jgi:beta-lactamase class A